MTLQDRMMNDEKFRLTADHSVKRYTADRVGELRQEHPDWNTTQLHFQLAEERDDAEEALENYSK